jgi:hypothetical protein
MGCKPASQYSKLFSVGVVLYHAQLDVLLEVFPEFVEGIDLLIIS